MTPHDIRAFCEVASVTLVAIADGPLNGPNVATRLAELTGVADAAVQAYTEFSLLPSRLDL
jgi:hypothetical protein